MMYNFCFILFLLQSLTIVCAVSQYQNHQEQTGGSSQKEIEKEYRSNKIDNNTTSGIVNNTYIVKSKSFKKVRKTWGDFKKMPRVVERQQEKEEEKKKEENNILGNTISKKNIRRPMTTTRNTISSDYDQYNDHRQLQGHDHNTPPEDGSDDLCTVTVSISHSPSYPILHSEILGVQFVFNEFTTTEIMTPNHPFQPGQTFSWRLLNTKCEYTLSSVNIRSPGNNQPCAINYLLIEISNGVYYTFEDREKRLNADTFVNFPVQFKNW